MADKRPEGLLHRIRNKAADRLGETVAGWLIEGVKWLAGTLFGTWVVVLARHWIAAEWRCVNSPWCTVSGWSLGLLIAVTVVIAAAAAFLAARLYRGSHETTRAPQVAAPPSRSNARVYGPGEGPFQKITVIDGRLKLRWFIIRPPKDWRYWRDIQNKLSPEAVQQVLDGPFHAVPGCNAALGETWVGTAERFPVFDDTCPNCGKRIFRGIIANGAVKVVRVFAVRAQALEELQRMERNTTVLDATVPVVLEKPAYWKAMLPP